MASPDYERGERENLAPLISVVGCDGSGKSTLSQDLVAWLGRVRPAENAYLGLGSGNIGNRIRKWPLIGRPFEAHLARKASQARDKKDKIPGLATALVIYGFSLIRRRRFKDMLAKRRNGVLIITDRYPQTEVTGFYDGPGLSAARPDSALVRWLSRRELAMYEWMASYVPNLVIRLNIDVATALARKPDDKPVALEAKVEVTPLLRFNGAEIVDLSSLDPYEDVLASAKRVIRDKLAAMGETVPAVD